MKDPTVKRVLAKKPWVKIILIAIMTLTVLCALLWVNAVWGNPIRKQMAKSNCLGYYQDQYHELFIVHEIDYSSKLPGYVLILSPESDPQIQFTCNPNCEPLCYSDEYGGVLASRLLVEQIRQILEPDYGGLAIQINASEDPFTWYEGENPDYFEKNPLIRLTKNHQNLSIAWVDPSLGKDDFEHLAEDIAGLIETHLPVINPDLQVTIAIFHDQARQTARYQTIEIKFPTFMPEN